MRSKLIVRHYNGKKWKQGVSFNVLESVHQTSKVMLPWLTQNIQLLAWPLLGWNAICCSSILHWLLDRRTGGQEDKRTGGQEDRRTGGQKDRRVGRQEDRRTYLQIPPHSTKFLKQETRKAEEGWDLGIQDILQCQGAGRCLEGE